jgi:hypothetical protein
MLATTICRSIWLRSSSAARGHAETTWRTGGARAEPAREGAGIALLQRRRRLRTGISGGPRSTSSRTLLPRGACCLPQGAVVAGGYLTLFHERERTDRSGGAYSGRRSRASLCVSPAHRLILPPVRLRPWAPRGTCLSGCSMSPDPWFALLLGFSCQGVTAGGRAACGEMRS